MGTPISATVEGKQCTVCGISKPATEYYAQPHGRDGLTAACKTCSYERSQALRKKKQQRQGTDHLPTAKQCAKCGLAKPPSQFSILRASNDGLGRFCRECDNAVSRARRYKIPEDRVRQMAARVNCEVCGVEFESSKHQHIDHRHSDGAVRGVLCRRCNSLIGIAEERTDRLRAVAEYLERTASVDYRTQPYPEQNGPMRANSSAEPFPPEGTADTCQKNTHPQLSKT